MAFPVFQIEQAPVVKFGPGMNVAKLPSFGHPVVAMSRAFYLALELRPLLYFFPSWSPGAPELLSQTAPG